jgi:hypothetical protein
MFTGFLLPRGPRSLSDEATRFDRDARPAREQDIKRVTVRMAEPADLPALERVAGLDSAHVPDGDLLVAEVAGSIQAALPLHGGREIANPFIPTADLLKLLEMRAAQLRELGDHGRVMPVTRRVRLA